MMEDVAWELSEPNEIIAFYEFIRDQSGRLEEEWREEFITYFPECDNILPESQDPNREEY